MKTGEIPEKTKQKRQKMREVISKILKFIAALDFGLAQWWKIKIPLIVGLAWKRVFGLYGCPQFGREKIESEEESF